MTNPSEVVADLRIAAEDARRFSAALFDRGYVRREGVRPFSELLERAADTIDRLTSSGEAVAWRIEGVNITDDPARAEAWRHLFKGTDAPVIQPLYTHASPREGHVEVPVEPKWERIDHPHRPREADYEVEQLQKRLKQFPDAAVETLTTWALVQPGQGSFAGALWAIAEFVASKLAALPHNQGETKP